MKIDDNHWRAVPRESMRALFGGDGEKPKEPEPPIIQVAANVMKNRTDTAKNSIRNIN